MARHYARILTNIWDNEEFVDLDPDAKLLYFHVCSRRDLSFSGHLVMRERLWAQQVFKGDLERSTAALQALAAGDYVIIDETTNELFVRTFIRHDGAYRNPKMRPAIRSCITRVESERLRTLAATEFDACLGSIDGSPPPDPDEDLVDHQSDHQSDHRSDHRYDREPDRPPDHASDHTYSLHPSTHTDQSSVVTASRGALTLVHSRPDDDDRIQQAIELHALHESTGKKKPDRYATTIRTNDPIERGDDLRAYLERHPDATAHELAHMVLAVPTSETLPDRRPPAPVYPPCDDCANSGRRTVWATRPDGTEYSPGVEPCHCPQGQTMRTA